MKNKHENNMKTVLLEMAGIGSALTGLSLSYNIDDETRVARVAERLFDNLEKNFATGEMKFLEFVRCWIDITAPRYWWQQFDTYRVGISKQSESTMHSLIRRELTEKNFTERVDRKIIKMLNEKIKYGDLVSAKQNLPEGFMQRRIIATDLKILNYIRQQRQNHKLEEWQQFAKFINNVNLLFKQKLEGNIL